MVSVILPASLKKLIRWPMLSAVPPADGTATFDRDFEWPAAAAVAVVVVVVVVVSLDFRLLLSPFEVVRDVGDAGSLLHLSLRSTLRRLFL